MSAWKRIHTTQDGGTVYMRPDSAGGWEFQTITDTAEVLRLNQAFATDGSRGWTKSRSMQRVASIPLALVDLWRAQGLNIFDRNAMAAVRKRLNDSQYSALRTGGGRL